MSIVPQDAAERPCAANLARTRNPLLRGELQLRGGGLASASGEAGNSRPSPPPSVSVKLAEEQILPAVILNEDLSRSFVYRTRDLFGIARTLDVVRLADGHVSPYSSSGGDPATKPIRMLQSACVRRIFSQPQSRLLGFRRCGSG
jgi:hypothetical protein